MERERKRKRQANRLLASIMSILSVFLRNLPRFLRVMISFVCSDVLELLYLLFAGVV